MTKEQQLQSWMQPDSSDSCLWQLLLNSATAYLPNASPAACCPAAGAAAAGCVAGCCPFTPWPVEDLHGERQAQHRVRVFVDILLSNKCHNKLLDAGLTKQTHANMLQQCAHLLRVEESSCASAAEGLLPAQPSFAVFWWSMPLDSTTRPAQSTRWQNTSTLVYDEASSDAVLIISLPDSWASLDAAEDVEWFGALCTFCRPWLHPQFEM